MAEAPLMGRLDFYAAMVRSNAFTRSALAVAFILLYRRMNGRTGRCDPSIATLAEETGFPERSVREPLSELRKARMVANTPRVRRDEARTSMRTARGVAVTPIQLEKG
jgi:hypothetical protein